MTKNFEPALEAIAKSGFKSLLAGIIYFSATMAATEASVAAG